MSQLVTGEAVALDVRTAGLPSRMVAALIDGLLQGALFFVLFLLTLAFGIARGGAALAALVIISVVVAFLGYPVAFETLMRGRTPGKAAMGLRVVRDDAGPIAFRQAFVRGLIGLVVERPGISSFSAGVITSLARTDGKRLGDLVAGTVVISERVVGTSGSVLPMPPPLAGWATTLDLSRLPDDLALSVRSFLGRQGQLTEQARTDLGNRLVAAVSATVTPPAPAGTPGWAYLAAVLAERRRRAEQQVVQAAPPAPAPPATAPPAPAPPAPAPPAPAPTSAAAHPTPPAPEGGFALPF